MGIKRILKRMREVVFKMLNRNSLVFLFFLILSGAFWLSMTLDETTDREYPVAVALTGVPDNAVITTEMTDTIHLVLRDKGMTLMTYWLGKGIAPIVFNFSKYASSEHLKGTITTVDIQKAVTKNLHSSTKIVSMKPERLEFYFNYGQRKEVPVRLTGNMDPAGSYYLASTHVEPSTVAVYASQKLLDSLNSVTAKLDITNYEDTVVQTVPLTKRTGMKCVPAEVKVTLCPDILTEQTIEVPVTAVGMPADKILRTFPAKVEVSFNVGASVFRFIHPEQFTVQADYNDIVANPSEKCTLKLIESPQTVRNAHLVNNQVDYLIEQR
ncbi:MAG: YbbR-like domain-containing protein [Prevotella sp.]|nr:YbbR-like domain-containing protein [Prevotella sp.]